MEEEEMIGKHLYSCKIRNDSPERQILFIFVLSICIILYRCQCILIYKSLRFLSENLDNAVFHLVNKGSREVHARTFPFWMAVVTTG